MTVNQRGAPRQRVLKTARVIMDDWRSMDCAIRDISDTGARIKIGNTAILPHKFKLLLVAENTIRPVQVAWKHGEQIGVTFTGPAEIAPPRKFVTGLTN